MARNQNFDESKKPAQNNQKRNRRPRSKGNKKVEEIVDFNAADLPNAIMKGKNPNDFAWYNNNPEVIEDVARIPFSLAEGAPYTTQDHIQWLTTPAGVALNVSNERRAFPGILAFSITPTLGRCSDTTDALNIAAMQLFTQLRNAVSGQMAYEQNEPMMFVIAAASVIALYEHLSRGYRTACISDYQNKYLPDALLRAQGFAPSLRSNRTRWKSILDYLALKLSSLNIPARFSIIDRMSWMFANVFTDSNTAKAQMYLMKPYVLWQWQEGVDGEPSKVVGRQLRALSQSNNDDLPFPTFESMENAIDALLSPLLGSGDVSQINGQLLKAFGSEAMVKYKYQTPDEPQSLSYSKEVLSQFENATILNAPITNLYVVQELNDTVKGPYLKCKPQMAIEPTNPGTPTFAQSGLVGMKHLLNFHWDNVTYQDVTVATRLAAVADTVSTTTPTTGVLDLICGSEVIQYAQIYQLSPNDLNVVGNYTLTNSTLFTHESPTDPVSVDTGSLAGIGRWSTFDWAPIHYLITAQGTYDQLTNYQLLTVIADIDNTSWISAQDLQEIHKACIISEWMLQNYPLNRR